MINWLKRYYWPMGDSADGVQIAGQRTFGVFIAMAGIVGVLISILNIRYLADFPAQVAVGFLISLVSLATPFLVYHSKHSLRIIQAFSTFFFASLAWLAFQNEALISSGAVSMIGMVITTTLVLGGLASILGLFFTLGTFFTIFFLFHTEQPVIILESGVVIDWINILLVMVTLTIFGFAGAIIFRIQMVKVVSQLRRAKRDADQANHAKSAFLANMSHEFRTPLNGVLGMVQLMEMSQLNDNQSKQVSVIRSSGEALLGTINDILDFSKLDSGALELDPAPFEITELLDQVYDTIQGIVLKKGLVYRTRLDAPTRYYGDLKRLRQILSNLAGNAVKFTDSGSVEMCVKQLECGQIRFELSDTGPGIAQEAQKRIFDRFSQADNSITRSHGGSGLGLSIVKELVELMGGEIGVDSVKGEGATFWFVIPLKPLDAATIDVKTYP